MLTLSPRFSNYIFLLYRCKLSYQVIVHSISCGLGIIALDQSRRLDYVLDQLLDLIFGEPIEPAARINQLHFTGIYRAIE